MNPKTYHQDEIDLFEVIAALWAGKWVIVASGLAATFSAFLFLLSVEPSYQVESKYNSSIYSVVDLQHCGGQLDCAYRAQLDEAVRLLEGSWRASSSGSVLLETAQPLTPETYQHDFVRVANILMQRLYDEALAEIALINNDLSGALSGTELAATNMLNAQRIVQAVDDSQAEVYFDPVSVT